MSQKKVSTKQKQSASMSRNDVRRLYQIGQDESQSEEARDWLWGFFSDLASNAACIDYVNDRAVFTRALSEVLSNIESRGAQGRNEHYLKLKEVLERVNKGETLDGIYQETRAARRKREEERNNAPEPTNWRSQEWRHWKIRQLTRALNSDDTAAREAAFQEYKTLLSELVRDEDFYCVPFMVALLPDLIIARQDIAQFAGQPRSARRKPAYFKARKGGTR